jgi:hypothetical protein
MAPWVKTGGLGDVAAALPAALHRARHDVRVLLPAYPALRTAFPQATAIADGAEQVLDRNAEKMAKLREAGFTDDDYDNFERSAKELAREVKKGRWPGVKIYLFFNRTDHPTVPPHVVIIRENGEVRPAFGQEQVEDPIVRMIYGRQFYKSFPHAARDEAQLPPYLAKCMKHFGRVR